VLRAVLEFLTVAVLVAVTLGAFYGCAWLVLDVIRDEHP
jgi:hypothetical protein